MSKPVTEQVKELRERNAALVQKVQFWKMTAAQREDEKLDLIRELNELRLTLSHYRSTGNALDKALDSAMQKFGEHALTRLVDISSSITGTIEIMKNYMRKKQEIEYGYSESKLSIRSSPKDRSSNRVSRVAPMIGGQSIIKPVIYLRAIDAQVLPSASANTEPTGQDLPTTIQDPRQQLQDLYIPLRRIDSDMAETDNVTRRSRHTQSLDDSTDQFDDSLDGLNESGENLDVEQEAGADDPESEEEINYNAMREMEPLLEDSEPEDENSTSQAIISMDLQTRRSYSDPLEGPSWLLDSDRSNTARTSRTPPTSSKKQSKRHARSNNLEPDSTTEPDVPESQHNIAPQRPLDSSTPAPAPSGQGLALSTSPAPGPSRQTVSPAVDAVSRQAPEASRLTEQQPGVPESPPVVHTPTRRTRHKRTRLSSPRVSLHILDGVWPQPSVDSGSKNGNTKDPTKVYVMVSKMHFADVSGGGEVRGSEPKNETPKKRVRVPLEAPSPNGSTRDAGPIVMDCSVKLEPPRGSSGESEEEAGGAGGGRSKRRRKASQISYKEKPLNRKLRR